MSADIASVSRKYRTDPHELSTVPDATYRPWRLVCKHRAALLDAVGVLEEWAAAHPDEEIKPAWSVIIK